MKEFFHVWKMKYYYLRDEEEEWRSDRCCFRWNKFILEKIPVRCRRICSKGWICEESKVQCDSCELWSAVERFNETVNGSNVMAKDPCFGCWTTLKLNSQRCCKLWSWLLESVVQQLLSCTVVQLASCTVVQFSQTGQHLIYYTHTHTHTNT